MTLTIEVDDDRTLNELKDFLGNRKQIRVVEEVVINPDAEFPEIISKSEMTDEERRAMLHSLYGSLKMEPERFREYEAFLHQIRNEWE